MISNIKTHIFNDVESCEKVLRSREVSVANMSMKITKVSEVTGRDYPALYNFTCNTPFSLNGAEHNNIRRCLASFLSAKRISMWKEEFSNKINSVFEQLKNKDEIDLFDDLASPVATSCIFFSLGISERQQDKINSLVDKMLVLSDGGYPLKVKDFARLDQCATDLADTLYDSLLYRDLGDDIDSLATNDFYNFMRIRYGFSKDMICSYLTVLLAAGVSTKHTLANMLVFMLNMNPEHRDDLLKADVMSVLEWLMINSGGVEKVYRLNDAGELLRLDIVEAAEKKSCPFSAEKDRELKHLGFGAGKHKCIGELLSKAILSNCIVDFYKLFPNASLITTNVPRFYTYTKSESVKIKLK